MCTCVYNECSIDIYMCIMNVLWIYTCVHVCIINVLWIYTCIYVCMYNWRAERAKQSQVCSIENRNIYIVRMSFLPFYPFTLSDSNNP